MMKKCVGYDWFVALFLTFLLTHRRSSWRGLLEMAGCSGCCCSSSLCCWPWCSPPVSGISMTSSCSSRAGWHAGSDMHALQHRRQRAKTDAQAAIAARTNSTSMQMARPTQTKCLSSGAQCLTWPIPMRYRVPLNLRKSYWTILAEGHYYSFGLK